MEYKGHMIRYSQGTDSRGAFYVPVINGECTMGEWERSPAAALRRGAQIIDEHAFAKKICCPKCGKRGPIWFNFLGRDELGTHGQYICRECDVVVRELLTCLLPQTR